jgi:hypothetical protein
MYQLALVPAAESMTPELAETMATVKTNMTAGSKSGAGSQARYFTMWERESSGISLASKRKASEAVTAGTTGNPVEGLWGGVVKAAEDAKALAEKAAEDAKKAAEKAKEEAEMLARELERCWPEWRDEPFPFPADEF